MNKEKNTAKGITLIALVITIIVMLILVAVTISMALNGGLFGYAKDATTKTKSKMEAESQLSTGRIKIGGVWYDSLQDYVDNKPSQDQSDTSDSTDNKIDYPVNDKIEFTYVDNGDGTASITSIKSLNTSKGTKVDTYEYEFYLNTDTLVLPSKTSEGKSITEVRISEPVTVTAKIALVGNVKDVKTIVFNSGIQKINGATKDFARFKTVTKVIIPDTVTNISADAFSCIDSNFEISFPLGVNKSLQIPENKWGAVAIEIKDNQNTTSKPDSATGKYTWEKYSFNITTATNSKMNDETLLTYSNGSVAYCQTQIVTRYGRIQFINNNSAVCALDNWVGNLKEYYECEQYKNYPFNISYSSCNSIYSVDVSYGPINNEYNTCGTGRALPFMRFSVSPNANMFTSTIAKGSYKYGEVESTDSTAYPQNGFQDGYWYVLKQS